MVVPSGFTIDTAEVVYEFAVSFKLTRCPAVAAKVSRAFWPGMAVATEVAVPLAVTATLRSAGTLCAVTVMPPVAAIRGSIHSV